VALNAVTVWAMAVFPWKSSLDVEALSFGFFDAGTDDKCTFEDIGSFKIKFIKLAAPLHRLLFNHIYEVKN